MGYASPNYASASGSNAPATTKKPTTTKKATTKKVTTKKATTTKKVTAKAKQTTSKKAQSAKQTTSQTNASSQTNETTSTTAQPPQSEASTLTNLQIHASKYDLQVGDTVKLIVDEYDNFTNVVLNEQGEEVYTALTHASGFYREIFKVFKGMFSKIFMTGVSPVTLDDLTSGFNIGWHISTKPAFNQMLGFSTEDVRELFT